jgi:hypothetical protein
MKTNLIISLKKTAPFFIILLLSLVYFLSLMQVPFHPDESTQIYMSSDLQKLFTSPKSLIWLSAADEDREMQLRMLDAPLTRYMIGLGGWLTNQDALPTDWDWTKSFEYNQQTGAFPANSLLLTARLSVSLVFPLSLVLLWLVLKKNFSPAAGWIGIFSAAGNALVLLHTRRAMAESLTFFLVIWLIYVLYQKKPSPVILGLAAGLVFCAKQSTAIWILAAFACVLFGSNSYTDTFKRKVINLFLCAVAFILIVLLLNPFLWKYPFSAFQRAYTLRQDLVIRQFADISRVSPASALNTPAQRAGALAANLFFTPPAIEDTANYIDALSISITRYNDDSLNSMLRDIPGGFLVLVFTLLGVYTAIRTAFKLHTRENLLLVFAGIAQFLFLAATVPLPFQRYIIPMVPTAIVFFAVGTSKLIELIYQRIITNKRRP